MAIIYVNKLETSSATDSGYTDEYQVKLSSNSHPREAITAVGKKKDDAGLGGTKVVSVSASQIPDSNIYEVSVNYEVPDLSASNGSDKPWDQPALISSSYQAESVEARKNYEDSSKGKEIKASNGEAITGIMVSEYMEILTVRKNTRHFRSSYGSKLGKVNSSSFRIGKRRIEKDQARLISISSSQAFYEGKRYYQVTTVIAIKPSGFSLEVLDVGRLDEEGKAYEIKRSLGKSKGKEIYARARAAFPVKLDGKGNPLMDKNGIYTPSAEGNYIDVLPYQKTTFSGLPLR